MVDWALIAGQVQGAVLEHLGRDVVYTPQSGQPVTIRAVYRGPHEAVSFDPMQISTTLPELFVRLADLPPGSRKGDNVALDTDTYRVTDIEPDGEGGALVCIAR